MYQHQQAITQAKALAAQMTLEEKASQLTYQSPAIPRLNIPAYNWWNEALHGVARAGSATVFPQAIGLAASFDPELLKQVAEVISTEGRAKYNAAIKHGDHGIYKGLTFWSPNVNIFRDPRWGRGHETYGEDPYLTSRLGVAFIKGLQGEGDYLKSAACAKHFAVHSGPEAKRHEFDAQSSPKDLWETYLPAFEACVKEAQVESVMGAYNRMNGEPCCGSFFLLEEILRKGWQFKGHVVSDCWAIADFHMYHHITSTPIESATLALKAGCDLNCGSMYLHLLLAHQEGLVTEEEITTSVERLLATRIKLGMFTKTDYDSIPYDVVECPEHLALAESCAAKSAVLLKNQGILPLSADKIQTVGVIGPNSNNRRALLGNYYGTPSRYITLLEGIQDYSQGRFRVLASQGCELWKESSEALSQPMDRLSEALTVAENSDVVILCLGLDETLEGEEMDTGNRVGSGDKVDLELPEVQRILLKEILATGKPVVLCLLAGSAMNLSLAAEQAKGILACWYPGAQGGKAIADILFGKISPSGKLPVTFYQTVDDLPDFEDYDMSSRTYRNYSGKPLYPFGFGLTYSQIQCVQTEPVSTEPWQEGQPYSLWATLENQSNVGSEDVVQVYIRCHQSPWAVKNTSLCAFKRVYVPAKGQAKVQLTIPAEAFTVVDDAGNRRYDGSGFTLYVETFQPDEVSYRLTGRQSQTLHIPRSIHS